MRRDASFLLLGRVVSAITTVLVLAIIARTRSADDLGVVGLGLTVSLALAVLPEAGLTALFIRESAKDPARMGRLLGAMIAIRLVALPLGFVAISAIVVVAYPQHARTIMLVAIGPALQQIAELARAVFIARQRMAVAGAHTIVENVAWAAAVALCLGKGADLDIAFSAAAAAVLVSAVAAFALVLGLARVRPETPSVGEVRLLLRQGRPFAAFSTVAVVGARMDTFLIGLLLPQGIAVAGAYYAVTRLVAVAEYVPDAVSRAVYPRLSRHYAKEPERAAATLAAATSELLALGIAIPFGFALVGWWLIGLLYGPDFTAYTWLFVAFGMAMPFRYLGFIFGVALTSAELQARRTRALAIAVGISLILNIILIPTIGIAGALVAGVANWVITCVLIVPDVERIFGRLLFARELVRYLGLAILAFLVGMIVRAAVGSPLGDPIAGIIFAGVGVLGWFGRPYWERLISSGRP